jgi:hypothetical protein
VNFSLALNDQKKWRQTYGHGHHSDYRSRRFGAAGRRLFFGASNPTPQATLLSPLVSCGTMAIRAKYLPAALLIPAVILTLAWMAFLGWALLRLFGFL